jgi:hypothetical protein
VNALGRGSARQLGSCAATALLTLALVGALIGAAAQLLRQGRGAVAALGASTAPWTSIGFLLAVRLVRARPFAERAVRGGMAMGSYLVGWLVTYHGLFAVRESVGLEVGWQQARPWLAAAVPVSAGVGLVVAASREGGRISEVCLAAPIGWSLPEIVGGVDRGWAYAALVSLPAAFLASIPALAMVGRGFSLVVVLCSSLGFGVVAYVASSLVGNH